MLSSEAPHKLRLAAYTMTGVYGCFTPILSGWCNISCGGDQHLRAATLSSMIVVGTILVTPFQQNVFPSSEAPFYKNSKGFIYGLVFVICLAIWTVVVIPLIEHYSQKREKEPIEVDLEERSVETIELQNKQKN